MIEATRDLQRLADLAASLRPRFAPEKPLPRLLFVTDPVRSPDPAAVAAALPAGSGVIYRAFGAVDAQRTAAALAAIAAQRGLLLLIGADATLAASVGAGGVHLPERDIERAPALRRDNPGWTITAAAHSPAAARLAGEMGCDAVLASTVFASASASAGTPMGAAGFSAFVAAAPLPVYALGGVNVKTAPELLSSGAAGLAMVEGLADAVRT
jgi:thiamine-phosphate pyrophosphorylase